MPARTNYAVAFSRVDWDKGTHIILEANNLLPADKQVQIYGAINRFYSYQKLDKIDPDWERNYHGGWPAKSSLWHGVQLAASAHVSVDLSSISGDGGGTQYSFLESFDAKTPLILNEKWLTGDPELDEVEPAIAGTVSNSVELADMLSSGVAYNDAAAEQILNKHNSISVAKNLMNVLLSSRERHNFG
jgi:hypothetical protein